MKFKTKTIIEITGRRMKFFQASMSGVRALNFGKMINIESLTDDAITQQLLNLRKDKKLRFKDSQIVLVIPRQYAILRYLDLPSQNKEELRAMADLQSVNHLPYSREELVIDFLPLEKNSEGYTKILIIAVLKETIVRFEKILEDAGLAPHQITLSFIGIWQWYQQHYSANLKVSALVDIDSDGSEICFCDQKSVLISRPTALGIKEIEAKEYGRFFEQLDWTIATYVKEQLGHPVEMILLLSSMDGIEDLQTYFQEKYSVDVNLIGTLKGVPARKSFVCPDALVKEGASVTAILGFLQTSLGSPIDLTPWESRALKISAARQRQWGRLIIVGIIALASIGVSLSLNFFKQNTQLQQLQDKVRSTQQAVALIKQKQHRLDILKGIVDNRIVFIDIIGEIYRSLPEGVVLTNLNLSQDHALSLQGYTSRVGDINDMQKSFVDSAYFDNVNLDFVNKRVTIQGEINYFKITAHVKPKDTANEEVK